jgi:phosphatidylinositol alpha 1,6-mannosyltransferase
VRVVYFTESLYPLVDGVSRTLARLFATLEKRGVEFAIFSPFKPTAEISWRDRVREVGYFRFPPYPDYRVALPYSKGIAADVAAFSPDLIHVVSPTPFCYRGQTIARSLGVPVVASFHTHFVSYFRYYGVRWLEPLGWEILRRFYRGCARVYAPSLSIIRELRLEGIDRVELWSRGIDLERFTPEHRDSRLRELAGADRNTPLLLFVSRLVKEKDLADLVSVARILRERGVRFSLALVGDGPMRSELEHAIPNGLFLGHLSGPELARWYASADAFIFPSTTETLGNVVLEALASGVPAVVVDRGGPQDLIEQGSNGFIANANDPEDIASHVQALLENTELRETMSRQARASARSRNWEEVNGGLLASYAEVIAEGVGSPLERP